VAHKNVSEFMRQDRESNDPNQGHAFANTYTSRRVKQGKEDEHYQEQKAQVQAQLYAKNSSKRNGPRFHYCHLLDEHAKAVDA
jgi:hypothetical protein